MDWISTNDKVPDDGVSVLTWRDGRCHIMYLRNNLWYHDGTWSTFGAESAIDYWMPLPGPPSRESTATLSENADLTS